MYPTDSSHHSIVSLCSSLQKNPHHIQASAHLVSLAGKEELFKHVTIPHYTDSNWNLKGVFEVSRIRLAPSWNQTRTVMRNATGSSTILQGEDLAWVLFTHVWRLSSTFWVLDQPVLLLSNPVYAGALHLYHHFLQQPKFFVGGLPAQREWAGPVQFMKQGKITAQRDMAAGHVCTSALVSWGEPVFLTNVSVVILIH